MTPFPSIVAARDVAANVLTRTGKISVRRLHTLLKTVTALGPRRSEHPPAAQGTETRQQLPPTRSGVSSGEGVASRLRLLRAQRGMNTLKIGSGRVRAELRLHAGELDVTVYRTPTPGSAGFARQMERNHRVLTTGRAQEERAEHLRFQAQGRQGRQGLLNLLNRHSLRPLSRGDQAQLDALLNTVFGPEAGHAAL